VGGFGSRFVTTMFNRRGGGFSALGGWPKGPGEEVVAAGCGGDVGGFSALGGWAEGTDDEVVAAGCNGGVGGNKGDVTTSGGIEGLGSVFGAGK